MDGVGHLDCGGVPTKKTEMHLTDGDQVLVKKIRSMVVHRSREVNRAHALSCLDRGVPEAQILEGLGIGRAALWRSRLAPPQGRRPWTLIKLERVPHTKREAIAP